MRTSRRLAMVGSLVAALASIAAGGAVSRADAASWHLDYRFTEGSISYTLLGHMRGAPGNAHSGQVYFDTSDDEDDAWLIDWQCPSGVVPPTYYNPTDPGTTCTVVRSLEPTFGTQLRVPSVDQRMRAAFEHATHPVFDDLAQDWTDYSITSRYVLVGCGPVTTTVDASQPGFRDVTRSRSARPHGHFGWVDFDDPRMRFSDTLLLGDWQYSLG